MRQVLCKISQVPAGSTVSFTIDNQSYIVTHPPEGLRVYINRCPHLGIPLEWQENDFVDPDTQLIRCASHGALFLHDTGECVSGPCFGDGLPAIPFFIEAGQIVIKIKQKY